MGIFLVSLIPVTLAQNNGIYLNLETETSINANVVGVAFPLAGGGGRAIKAGTRGADLIQTVDKANDVGRVASGTGKVDEVLKSTSKIVSNQFGRIGKPEHVNMITSIAEEISNQGGKIISGGGNKVVGGELIRNQERRIVVDAATNKYRYPDIHANINGKDVFINVGKTKTEGSAVNREIAAITDLSKVGRTEFVPYDKPFDIQKFVGGLR